MNIAVILAGGSGSRFGNSTPKQFLKVAGKSVIEHTIDVFEHNSLIDEICVVSKSDYVPVVEQIVLTNEYRKVKKILSGGIERYHSSLAAINAYTNDEVNLIFHDAVRPLVNERIISDCVAALSKYSAVDVAINTTDTIIAVDSSNCIHSIPNRAALRNGQTPQCFRRGTIRRAYELALRDPDFNTTDDCGVVRKYLPEESVYVVEGEISNMKLTYLEDIFLLDKLFQLRTSSCIDQQLEPSTIEQLQQKVVVVFGGSYGIGGEIMHYAQEQNAHIYGFSRSMNNTDVSDPDAVQRAFRFVFEQEGQIDVVIVTAGVLIKEALATMKQEEIDASININLLGAINVARSAFEYLKQTQGSLLFFTSSSYTRGRMMYSVYSATKAAVVNFVQALAEEWYSHGIRVNCINPERTKTPMRIRNFGNEPEDTLLDPKYVAIASLNVVFSNYTGEIFDVRRRKQ